MKLALIDTRDNTIVQVEPQGGDFPVHPDYAWTPCPDDAVAYSWTYDGTSFSPPAPPPLETLKAVKHAQIERERDAACYANVSAHGRPWQTDPHSQQMIANAILLVNAGVPLPAVWRDANNDNMPLTHVSQLVQIAEAIAAQTEAAYATSWTRKAALEVATTAAEIDLI